VRFLPSVLVCLLIAGCAGIAEKAKITDVPHLESLEDSSSYRHLIYRGSDDHFHYFAYFWCGKVLMHQKFYKVERYRLNLEKTFELGEEKGYVVWPGTIARAAAGGGSVEPGAKESKAGATKAK